jgi:hypothetical protein
VPVERNVSPPAPLGAVPKLIVWIVIFFSQQKTAFRRLLNI